MKYEDVEELGPPVTTQELSCQTVSHPGQGNVSDWQQKRQEYTKYLIATIAITQAEHLMHKQSMGMERMVVGRHLIWLNSNGSRAAPYVPLTCMTCPI